MNKTTLVFKKNLDVEVTSELTTKKALRLLNNVKDLVKIIVEWKSWNLEISKDWDKIIWKCKWQKWFEIK